MKFFAISIVCLSFLSAAAEKIIVHERLFSGVWQDAITILPDDADLETAFQTIESAPDTRFTANSFVFGTFRLAIQQLPATPAWNPTGESGKIIVLYLDADAPAGTDPLPAIFETEQAAETFINNVMTDPGLVLVDSRPFKVTQTYVRTLIPGRYILSPP